MVVLDLQVMGSDSSVACVRVVFHPLIYEIFLSDHHLISPVSGYSSICPIPWVIPNLGINKAIIYSAII